MDRIMSMLLERMMRIELTPSAWKAEALPICNIRIAGLAGLDPANFRLTVECCTNSATDQCIISILNKVRYEK